MTMNKTALLALGVIMLTVSAVGVLASSYIQSHTIISHLTVPTPEITASGDFTVTDFTFIPSSGTQSAKTITINSNINVPTTLTIAIEAGHPELEGFSVSLSTPVTIPAGTQATQVTIYLTIPQGTSPGTYDIPIVITVTQ